MHKRPASGFGRAVDGFEETLIAAVLGLMTLITFANVVARFMGENILWALEATSFLFAWLVLLGASYCVKHTAHLGVDALLNLLSPPARRALGVVAGLCCIVFSLLMLKGGWDYWANFAGLPSTNGRWFPTGFEDSFRDKGWYEVNDIDMPGFLNPFFANLFNLGEPYEKIPRLIPYAVMPLSMALLTFRFIQATLRIARGEQEMLIVSHEAEDLVEEAAAKAAAVSDDDAEGKV